MNKMYECYAYSVQWMIQIISRYIINSSQSAFEFRHETINQSVKSLLVRANVNNDDIRAIAGAIYVIR
jgi:hypothetical protein